MNGESMDNRNPPMHSAVSLKDIRQEIDALDDQLLQLLSRRAGFAEQVAEIKQAAGEVSCFYRPEREVEVLQRAAENNPGPLSDAAITRFFREVMSECLALEQPLRVAFLGPMGTFSQQAAYKHFGQAIAARPVATLDEIFREVASETSQYGVVPVENSTEGSITQTLDGFIHADVLIAGEVQIRIHHNLMALSTDQTAIREVFSHPQSLAQCRLWLERHLPGIRCTEVSSNAEAARRASQTPGTAAIAGVAAAAHYGLAILAANIEDEPDNTTRFLVIGRSPVGPTGHDKTSLLLATRNHPGALASVLEPFARLGIGLSKIESRPSRRVVWDYLFFIDVEGHQDDPLLARALKELADKVTLFKVLGSYPRAIDHSD